MDALLNAMRREAERVGANVAHPRMAIVSSYNPADHTIKAKLQPEGIETGWFPWASSVVGNGWGLFAPPSPGDQVVVLFQEGSGGSPIGIGAIYNDEDRAVVEGLGGAPSGEAWLVHQSGSRIRLLNDSGIEIRHQSEARIRLLEDGTIEVQQQGGTQLVLRPDGTVDLNAPTLRIGAEGGTFRKLVNDTFMQLFNSHVHGNTPPPTTPMTPAHLTENLTGA